MDCVISDTDIILNRGSNMDKIILNIDILRYFWYLYYSK